MLEDKANIRKYGNSICVIIPASVWKDSTNKFTIDQQVNVKLSQTGKELKIE